MNDIPDDTIRIKALYRLSELTLEDKSVDKADKIEAYFNEALILSLSLQYKAGYQYYFEHMEWFYEDKIKIPLIRTHLYPEYITKNKARPLFEAGNLLFNVSFYTYLRLINQSVIHKMTHKSYVLWYFTALAYIDQVNYSHACNHLHTALKGALHANDSVIIADAYAVMGYAKYFLHETDSAGIYFERALSYLPDIRTRYVTCMNNAGEVQFAKHNYFKALELFRKAFQGGLAAHDSSGRGWSLHNEGRTWMQLKSFHNAENSLTQSLHIASQIKEIDLKIRNLYCLSEVSHSLGKNQLEKEYHSRFMQAKDSLLAEELDRLLKSREHQWQTDIGREITRKETEAWHRRFTTLELNNTKTFVFALTFISIVLIIMMIMLYRMYRFKKQAAGYLNELNKSRDRLYAIVSHDLRSPLISLGTSLEYLKNAGEQLPIQDIRENIIKMMQLTDNTRFLLDNLLMWLKDQKGLIEYSPEIVKIEDIIYLNDELFRSAAENKNIRMIHHTDPDVKVYSDKNMLDLMIRNLLNNALKFTGPGGQVNISTYQNNGQVFIQVSDNGRGLDSDELEKLHNHKTDRKKTNTGLGLILIKDFLLKAGGTMTIESKGKDTGSCFTIILHSYNPDNPKTHHD